MSKYKIKFKDKEFDASEYQDAIFDNVEHGVGNMIVSAAAGASKTTTAVNCLNIIPENKKVLFIAFNKDIVEEIRNRIGDKRGTKISTFHSLGFSIFIENHGSVGEGGVNEFKYRNYIKGNIEELSEVYYTLGKRKNEYVQNIIKLVDYSRYFMVFNPHDISVIADKYGIDIVADECDICRTVLKWGKENLEAIDWRPDFVFTHCASDRIEKKLGVSWPSKLTAYFETLEDRLPEETIWLFGHYHIDAVAAENRICLYEQIARID
jgi:hypothetical protein